MLYDIFNCYIEMGQLVPRQNKGCKNVVQDYEYMLHNMLNFMAQYLFLCQQDERFMISLQHMYDVGRGIVELGGDLKDEDVF